MDSHQYKIMINRQLSENTVNGEPVWPVKIFTGSLFTDPSVPFEVDRDQFTHLIETSHWFTAETADSELHRTLRALSVAEDVAALDVALREIYKLADDAHIWISA